jgi:hypothetical protein
MPVDARLAFLSLLLALCPLLPPSLPPSLLPSLPSFLPLAPFPPPVAPSSR